MTLMFYITCYVTVLLLNKSPFYYVFHLDKLLCINSKIKYKTCTFLLGSIRNCMLFHYLTEKIKLHKL